MKKILLATCMAVSLLSVSCAHKMGCGGGHEHKDGKACAECGDKKMSKGGCAECDDKEKKDEKKESK